MGSTDAVPLSVSGNAEIRDTVELPAVCDDPIVLVRAGNGRWIAGAGL